MERQHQIKRTLSTPESIEVIRRLLADGMHASRSALVHTTCNRFGFVDGRGRAQTAGCVKALRELEHAGHFALPAAGRRGRRPRDVPASAGDVQGWRWSRSIPSSLCGCGTS
jgi:hypothetical protein